MKSMQNRLQNHNLSYVNCTEHLNLNSNSSWYTNFSGAVYGSNNQNAHLNHLAYAASSGCYRQSLSGSETDLSTSTENLTHEEKYVLRNSTRQEPQGEETLDSEDNFGGNIGRDSGGGGGGTYRGGGSSYTSMDQSSCNTLIIHPCEDDFEDEDEDDDEDEVNERQRYAMQSRVAAANGGEIRPDWNHHANGDYYANPMHYHLNYQRLQKQKAQQFVYLGQNSLEGPYKGESQHVSDYAAQMQTPRELTSLPKHCLDQAEVLVHLTKEAQVSTSLGSACSAVPSISTTTSSYNENTTGSTNASQTFFGAEFDLSKLPPPPKYPGSLSTPSKRNSDSTTPVTTDSSSASSPACSQGSTSVSSTSSPHYTTTNVRPMATTKGSLSRSQPDLSRLGRWDDSGNRRNNYLSQRPRTKGKASPEVCPALLHQRSYDIKYGGLGSSFSADILAMDKRLEAVEDENQRLKAELDLHTSKVSKLQKFEVDIQKVHSAYEDLVKSSNKRDRLHHAVRTKLESEINRLQEQNKDYRDQLDAANNHLLRRRLPPDFEGNPDVKREILKRDQLIAQLIQTNKELTAAKERHEIELAAQRATLQEQRTHIEILDSALSNAQANVVKLEEECRKKQSYVERVAQLQKALNALQAASERREQMERKLRKQLERDLHELRQQQNTRQQETKGGQQTNSASHSVNARSGGSGNLQDSTEYKGGSESSICSNSSEAVIDLKGAIREKEERIIALEAEVSKWEQRYLEENAIRQIAIDAASMPKDAKIAALERTSLESEKLIALARSDKLKQMDELHASNKRCADMESKIKDLESHLAERDAMIKVLQKHSIEKDAAFQNAMLRSPRHTPHPSFHSASTSVTTTARASSLSTVVPEETASQAGSGSGTSVGNLTSATPSPLVANATDESLDEQLNKLGSQLLSKDSIIHALRSEKEKYPNHYWMV